MNYDQATGIVRALCPAILSYCVGRGWISASDIGEYTAAAVAIAACIWSFINNKTGNVSGTGGLNIGKNAGAASAAIVALFLVYGGNAHAADVAPAMVAKAPVAAPATGCTQLSCTGFSIGGVIYGIGGNAAILQNGVQGSVFAGGGDIGINAGWQYWDGKYFVGLDVDGLLESQSNTGISGFAGGNGSAVGIVHFKLGGNLASVIANGPTAITTPGFLATSLMASYIDNCTAFRKGGTQYCGGAGQEFWLAKNLTMDVLYDYGAPTKNFNALQNVGVQVSYHF
jgi:hypothetical protein